MNRDKEAPIIQELLAVKELKDLSKNDLNVIKNLESYELFQKQFKGSEAEYGDLKKHASLLIQVSEANSVDDIMKIQKFDTLPQAHHKYILRSKLALYKKALKQKENPKDTKDISVLKQEFEDAWANFEADKSEVKLKLAKAAYKAVKAKDDSLPDFKAAVSTKFDAFITANKGKDGKVTEAEKYYNAVKAVCEVSKIWAAYKTDSWDKKPEDTSVEYDDLKTNFHSEILAVISDVSKCNKEALDDVCVKFIKDLETAKNIDDTTPAYKKGQDATTILSTFCSSSKATIEAIYTEKMKELYIDAKDDSGHAVLETWWSLFKGFIKPPSTLPDGIDAVKSHLAQVQVQKYKDSVAPLLAANNLTEIDALLKSTQAILNKIKVSTAVAAHDIEAAAILGMVDGQAVIDDHKNKTFSYPTAKADAITAIKAAIKGKTAIPIEDLKKAIEKNFDSTAPVSDVTYTSKLDTAAKEAQAIIDIAKAYYDEELPKYISALMTKLESGKDIVTANPSLAELTNIKEKSVATFDDEALKTELADEVVKSLKEQLKTKKASEFMTILNNLKSATTPPPFFSHVNLVDYCDMLPDEGAVKVEKMNFMDSTQKATALSELTKQLEDAFKEIGAKNLAVKTTSHYTNFLAQKKKNFFPLRKECIKTATGGNLVICEAFQRAFLNFLEAKMLVSSGGETETKDFHGCKFLLTMKDLKKESNRISKVPGCINTDDLLNMNKVLPFIYKNQSNKNNYVPLMKILKRCVVELTNAAVATGGKEFDGLRKLYSAIDETLDAAIKMIGKVILCPLDKVVGTAADGTNILAKEELFLGPKAPYHYPSFIDKAKKKIAADPASKPIFEEAFESIRIFQEKLTTQKEFQHQEKPSDEAVLKEFLEAKSALHTLTFPYSDYIIANSETHGKPEELFSKMFLAQVRANFTATYAAYKMNPKEVLEYFRAYIYFKACEALPPDFWSHNHVTSSKSSAINMNLCKLKAIREDPATLPAEKTHIEAILAILENSALDYDGIVKKLTDTKLTQDMKDAIKKHVELIPVPGVD